MDKRDERWEKLRTVLQGRVKRMAYASSHLGGLTRRGAYEDVLLLMEDIEDLDGGSE